MNDLKLLQELPPWPGIYNMKIRITVMGWPVERGFVPKSWLPYHIKCFVCWVTFSSSHREHQRLRLDDDLREHVFWYWFYTINFSALWQNTAFIKNVRELVGMRTSFWAPWFTKIVGVPWKPEECLVSIFLIYLTLSWLSNWTSRMNGDKFSLCLTVKYFTNILTSLLE